MPIHLVPTTDVAPRVVLPGDPARALHLATTLLGPDRKMANHHRGLWGYTGTAADGAPLTIQSTGIGGPSAAAVLTELAGLGVEVAVRVGTARALDPGLALGTLVAAGEVLGQDGTSRALGAPEAQRPDADLTAALGAAAGRTATVVSRDLFYGAGAPPEGAALADLQSAAVTAVAARHGIRLGVVLAVAHTGSSSLEGEALDDAGRALGAVAARALGLPDGVPA